MPEWFCQRCRLWVNDAPVRRAALEVVRAYEGVTTTDDWMSLVMPIYRLRAALNPDDKEEPA